MIHPTIPYERGGSHLTIVIVNEEEKKKKQQTHADVGCSLDYVFFVQEPEVESSTWTRIS
jgi:hypothetical protein